MTELTEKENAILCVLQKRSDCLECAIEVQKKHIAELEKEIAQRREQIAYFKAKREGYEQAIDLLKDSLEGITIELE